MWGMGVLTAKAIFAFLRPFFNLTVGLCFANGQEPFKMEEICFL